MASTEATDTDVTPAAPPGLHEAADENRECGNCVYYRSSGECTKFPPLHVSDEWLCGAWKAGGKDTDDQPVQARTVRGVQKEALARIRAASTPGAGPASRQGPETATRRSSR